MSNRTQEEYSFLHSAIKGAAERASKRVNDFDDGYTLAVGVLCRSILDLDITPKYIAPGSGPTAIDRAQAYIFCFATSGAWFRSRILWCDHAGIHPDAFKKVARRYLTLARSRAGCLTDDEFLAYQAEQEKTVAKETNEKHKIYERKRRRQRKDALPETPEFTL